MKKQFVYKVVNAGDQSVYAGHLKVRIQYRLGKVSKARIKGSKLFAFTNLNLARRFLKNDRAEGGSIFKAEATNTFFINERLPVADLMPETIRQFWAGEHVGYSHPIMAGVVGCDTIKLIEKL